MNRLVDGVLSAERTLFARKHLSECRRCRETFGFITDLREAAGDLYHPVPPARILEHVLEARAAGHRAILPQYVAVRRRRGLNPAFAVSILLGLVTVAGLLLLSKEAEAGSSQLLFDPPRPTDQELIRVEYHPGALLAGEEFVVLRGRLRTPAEPPPSFTLGQEVTVTLSRKENGVFSGSLVFPTDVMYLVAVVEDARGETIDSNGGRLWDLLRHEARDKPKLEAYIQQFLVWQRKRFDVAKMPAQDLTTAYPDRAAGWPLLLYQQQMSGSFHDSVAAEHKKRLAELTEALDEVHTTAGDLAALSIYARRLGDDSRYQEIDAVLQRRFPLHRIAVSHRMLRYRIAAGSDRRYYLTLLDREWQVSGLSNHNLAVVGWQQAQTLQDPFAMRLWSDRYLKVRPFDAAAVAVSYGTVPELFRDGLARMNRELRLIGDGYYSSYRPLEVTRHEFSSLLEHRVQEVLTALGTTALATGDTTSAIAFLREATGKLWSPKLFESQARLALVLGDTAQAIALLARIEVDPLANVPDDLAQQVTMRVSSSSWDAETRLARIHFESTLRSVEPAARRLPRFVVHDEKDVQVELPAALAGQVTVILLWSRTDRLALDRLGWLDVVPSLEDYDIRAVTIVDGRPTPEFLDGLSARAQSLPLLHDPTRTAASAFGSWAIRPLFVVDDNGYVRYRAATVEDAVRHAIMIRERVRLSA